jgi:tripartite-type tricarboxylate transporter receptor subunit TctC
MRRREFSRQLLAGALAGVLPTVVLAKDSYPTRSIRLVVPFTPGGTTDVVARLVSNMLGGALGQAIIIDNRGGAGGTLGADIVAKAPADGYTLLLFHIGMIYATALYKSLPFDVEKDFVPISLVGVAPSLLVVPANSPINSLAEFTAAAKAHPGAMNYGTAGVGTSGHLAVELYQQLAGVKVTHIPYKGGGPAITAVMAGEVQFMIETLGTLMPLLKGGRLKALAITSDTRSPALPDVPTMREAGLNDYVYTTWYGLWAPGKTPSPIVDELNSSLKKLLARDDVRAKLDQAGIEPKYTTRKEFADIIQSDLKLWGGLIHKAGITAQ